MKRVLDSIGAELPPEAAPWAADREAFAVATADAAVREFSGAFDRWRQLYQGARDQLKEANRKSELPGLSAKERRAAKEQQAQANEQLALLERGTSTYGSDFYTYRYLATEGASCPATTFRGCRFMPMCRRSARDREGEPPISSGRGL